MKQKILPNNFAIFILSHKRPENPTYKTLMKCNYSGKFYFVLDDLDESISQYEKNYGKDKLLIFSKKEVAKRIDFMSNWTITAIDTYARNACFDLAKEIGIDYCEDRDGCISVLERIKTPTRQLWEEEDDYE